MAKLARSAAAAEVWRQASVERRYALEPLRTDLKRERWTQVLLVDEIKRRVGVRVTRSTLNNYLNGYGRIPERVFWVICKIAGTDEEAIIGRVADKATLLQQPAKKRAKK